MPIPKPRADEDQSDFMGRCMGNETMMNDFPDQDQRVAVCLTQWRDRNKSAEIIPNRAYSTITTKAVDEDTRTIEGIASTPSTDRMGDIVESVGAKFNLPLPLLWQHNHDEPVGWVEVAKTSKDSIRFRARLAKITDPGELKNSVDKAWQAVKAGLVRGVSIGFRPTEYNFMDDGGVHFKEWDWMELSLVTIPANQEATIHSVKSFDDETRAALGNSQSVVTKQKKPGVSGLSKPVLLKSNREMAKKTLAEQKVLLENSRAAKAARMEEIQDIAAEEDRTKSEAEREEFDTLAAEIESIDKELADAYKLEKALVTSAKAVIGHNSQAAGEARDAGYSQRVTVMQRQLPKGIAYARFVRCCLAGGGIPISALGVAEKQYPDMDDLHMVLRAAVAAGSTQSNTWAGDLVQYQDMQGEFVEFMRPMTVIGRIPGLRIVPFNVRVPRQTTGGAAYWVGEGQPKPLTSFAFDTITMRFTKIANIAVLTDEVVRFSNPSIDAIVRDQLAAAIVQQMDSDFLDPTNAGTTDVKPASITNGVTPVVSSGATADDVKTDAVALLNKFIAANIPTSGLVWVMNETTATVLEVMQNALGQPEFPGVTSDGGRFFGRPVVTSQVMPAAGSPATSSLILMRPQDILIADDGRVTVDASREASLQMLDNPTNAVSSGSPATPVPTTMVSMFQTNAMALRAEREVNWARARAASVQYLSGVAYAV